MALATGHRFWAEFWQSSTLRLWQLVTGRRDLASFVDVAFRSNLESILLRGAACGGLGRSEVQHGVGNYEDAVKWPDTSLA